MMVDHAKKHELLACMCVCRVWVSPLYVTMGNVYTRYLLCCTWVRVLPKFSTARSTAVGMPTWINRIGIRIVGMPTIFSGL